MKLSTMTLFVICAVEFALYMAIVMPPPGLPPKLVTSFLEIPLSVAAAFAVLSLLPFASADPVRVEGGLVSGVTAAGVVSWKGVPYAAPPVGELRWQAPKPLVPWQGVRDATKFGAACLQGKIFGDISFDNVSEDCLTLNIWTPAKSARERLPVMVWIHGGGFQAGAGGENRHDGQAFARHFDYLRQVKNGGPHFGSGTQKCDRVGARPASHINQRPCLSRTDRGSDLFCHRCADRMHSSDECPHIFVISGKIEFLFCGRIALCDTGEPRPRAPKIRHVEHHGQHGFGRV